MKNKFLFLLPLVLLLLSCFESFAQKQAFIKALKVKPYRVIYPKVKGVASVNPPNLRRINGTVDIVPRKIQYIKGAIGDHTAYARNAQGKVYKYTTFRPTPHGADELFHYDGGNFDGTPGRPHFNKHTQQPVPTPHVHGYEPTGEPIEGGVRAAKPEEIPDH